MNRQMNGRKERENKKDEAVTNEERLTAWSLHGDKKTNRQRGRGWWMRGRKKGNDE